MKQNAQRKMTRSEYSRLGAIALNSDPEKKRASILKGIETKRRNKLQVKLGLIATEQTIEQWKKLLIDKDR
jgi:hypothetical protein